MSQRKQERTIPALNVYPLNDNTTSYILESEEIQKFIYEHTFNGIKEAIRTKKNIAVLFRLNNTDNYIELPKNEWINAIDSCIKYYEGLEKFEKCMNLTILKSNIKIRKNTKEIL
jgi:hypothetical protein